MTPKTLHGPWTTALAVLAGLLLTATSALADVSPDPADPAGPYSMIALVLVLIVTGIYLYRRRRK